MFLNKDQIFASKDIKVEVVDVPEWNDQVPEGQVAQVGVIRMSGSGKDDWEAYCRTKKDGQPSNLSNLRAKLVSLVITDEEGNLLFSEKEIKEIGKKSAIALDRLIEAAERVNRVVASDYDDLVKN